MKKTRFYKIIIVLLILVNVATLGYMWFGKTEHRPPKPGDMAKNLGITGDAANKITQLEEEHHKEKRKLMRKSLEQHEKLFKELGNAGIPNDQLAEINTTQHEIERMTFAFFDSVATYCNEEQLKELKETVINAYAQLRGPRKGRDKDKK